MLSLSSVFLNPIASRFSPSTIPALSPNVS